MCSEYPAPRHGALTDAQRNEVDITLSLCEGEHCGRCARLCVFN